MGSEDWPEVRLADLCESIDYGYTQSACQEQVGPKFLRITDIVSGPIDWLSVPFCEAAPDVATKYSLSDGDIVIARTGATTGTSTHVQSPPNAVFASYLVRLRIDRTKANSRFVAFYLRSPEFWDYIRAVLGDKSAQPNASAKTMTQATLRLPPMPEQRRIADILGALDDKIELIHRMNCTLESVASAIFMSWFVDFDSGGMNVGGGDSVPPPEDWTEVAFGDTVQILSGGTPRTSEPGYWGGEIPWYSVVDAPAGGDVFVAETQKSITEAGLENSAAQLVPALTTIISARGTVGKCALAAQPMAFNQSCFGLRPHDEVGVYYTYFSTLRVVDALRRSAHGSVFSTITRNTFRSVAIHQPPQSHIKAFENAVCPLMNRVRSNVRESHVLVGIRDALLPRLMSGDLRLNVSQERPAQTDA